MTIEEKATRIEEYCNNHIGEVGSCIGCPLFEFPVHEDCYSESDFVMRNYNVLFGQEDDPVNHPSHYTKGKIEVADFIADQKLNFDRGNAVKYVCRAGSKDPEKEIQDLEKAIWYINHEIKMLKGEKENGTEEN